MKEQLRKDISDFQTDVRSSFGMPEDVQRRINTDPHVNFELEEGQQVSILIGKRVEPEDPRWTVWGRMGRILEGEQMNSHYITAIGRGLEDALEGLGLEIGRKAIENISQSREETVYGNGFPQSEHESYRPIVVLKFGGTSVGGAPQIEGVSQIVGAHVKNGEAVVVVVSAMAGVTNRLVAICDTYESGDFDTREHELRAIFNSHATAASQLELSAQKRTDLICELNKLFTSLRNDVSSLDLTKKENRDKVLSYGERMSIQLINAKLLQEGVRAETIPSSDVIKTDDSFGEAKPDISLSQNMADRIIKPFLRKGVVLVITGFLGSTRNGRVTTLGRGGSDYAATYIASLLNAEKVVFFKDYDGIYTSDPRYNSDATRIDRLTHDQGDILAKNGTQVLHKRTLEPLRGSRTVLEVLSFNNPNGQGTIIS